MSWKKLSVMVKKILCQLTPRRGRQVQDQQAGQEANPVLRLQAPRSSASWQCQRNSSQGTTPSTAVIWILTMLIKLSSGNNSKHSGHLHPDNVNETLLREAVGLLPSSATHCGAGEIQRWRIRMCAATTQVFPLYYLCWGQWAIRWFRQGSQHSRQRNKGSKCAPDLSIWTSIKSSYLTRLWMESNQ